MACLKGIDCKYNFYVPVYELSKNGFSRTNICINARAHEQISLPRVSSNFKNIVYQLRVYTVRKSTVKHLLRKIKRELNGHARIFESIIIFRSICNIQEKLFIQ